jgi:hypothetical protein
LTWVKQLCSRRIRDLLEGDALVSILSILDGADGLKVSSSLAGKLAKGSNLSGLADAAAAWTILGLASFALAMHERRGG